jgi:hypothetical protein
LESVNKISYHNKRLTTEEVEVVHPKRKVNRAAELRKKKLSESLVENLLMREVFHLLKTPI